MSEPKGKSRSRRSKFQGIVESTAQACRLHIEILESLEPIPSDGGPTTLRSDRTIGKIEALNFVLKRLEGGE